MSETARDMRNRLPHWFRTRRDDESAGAQLLGVIGQGFDEAGRQAGALGSEFALLTADQGAPCLCYIADLPGAVFDPDFTVKFYGDGEPLNVAPDLAAFLRALVPDAVDTPEVFGRDFVFLDRDARRICVRKPYASLRAVIFDRSGGQVADVSLSLQEHTLWTTFDEFGLLLDTPRLPGESNEEYRRRLFTVSRLPGGADEAGLTRGLARGLGLLRDYVWSDGGLDFPVPHRHMNIETLLVDGEPVDETTRYRLPSGQLVLRGDTAYVGRRRRVTYAYGLSLHSFVPGDPIMDELYTPEGLATTRLLEYKERADKAVPIKWGEFTWGETFWDPGNDGTVSGVLDASVQGWQAP